MVSQWPVKAHNRTRWHPNVAIPRQVGRRLRRVEDKALTQINEALHRRQLNSRAR